MSELKKYCTIAEALEVIKSNGANISPAELRKIAKQADIPYRQGAGRTRIYPAELLINAFEATFQNNVSRLTYFTTKAR